MGFLGDLIDDVLSIPGQVVRKVAHETERGLCTLTGGHEWSAWTMRADGEVYRRCAECGAEDSR